MRELVQLDFVKEIITEYPDDIPLHIFLKDFYKKHRQFGSHDRRFYSEVTYKYLRCKTLFAKLPFEEKLCYSGFLTTNEVNSFYKYLFKQQQIELPLLENWDKTTEEKINLLATQEKISWTNYFPATPLIDPVINVDQFFKSHLTQPKFYIRARRNYVDDIKEKLHQNNISFDGSDETFAFTSQLDVSKFITKESYEVQDLSSQETIRLFNLEGNETVWDCCSGSGGKSLMLIDKYPELKLYCSDRRSNILENLKARFDKIKVSPKGVNVFDAVKKTDELIFDKNVIPENFFDVILADVPCSGSGTWGRNPERLYQFKEEEIAVYTSLQRSIIKNALKYLKPGGKLIYITCSVYVPENTQNILAFEDLGVFKEEQNYFSGYNRNADTLFGAVLRKNTIEN